jgi:hypothetical protein
VSPEAAADTSAATAPEADTTVAGETEAPAAAADEAAPTIPTDTEES